MSPAKKLAFNPALFWIISTVLWPFTDCNLVPKSQPATGPRWEECSAITRPVARSIVYGKMVDHVRAVKMILSDGNLTEFDYDSIPTTGLYRETQRIIARKCR